MHQTASLPLYIQIAERLRREIAAGHWRAGDRLPVESELAQHFNVAIGTLRKGLERLENEKLLTRIQGSGTYVSELKDETALYQFFHLELLRGGGLPTAKVLSIDGISDNTIADIFDAKSSDKFWRIRRQRALDDVIVAAEEIYIRHEHQPDFDEQIISESLYAHYRDHFDFWISRVEDQISCQPIPDWTRAILMSNHDDTSNHSPVMNWIRRYSWSQHQVIEEYSQTWFNPTLCQYTARWA